MSLFKWFRRRREWRESHNEAWRDWVVPVSAGLTNFQLQCEARLRESAQVAGVELPSTLRKESLSPEKVAESFLVIDIPSAKVTAFIYDDGAEFSGVGVDSRYERWDYQSPQELIVAFVDEGKQLLSGAKPAV